MIWRSGYSARTRARSRSCWIEIRRSRSQRRRFTGRILLRDRPGATRDLPYHLRVTAWDGSQQLTRDPYQYGPIMGEVDLHLFAEGQHWKIYEKFGAHLRTIGDATGVYFAVWAPNAQRVSVVGDFNGWDGRVNPMRKLHRQRRLGIIFARDQGRRALQIRNPHPDRRGAAQERSVRIFQSARQIDSVPGVRSRTLRMERRRMDGSAPEEELAAKPDQHLRSAPRLVAAQS